MIASVKLHVVFSIWPLDKLPVGHVDLKMIKYGASCRQVSLVSLLKHLQYNII